MKKVRGIERVLVCLAFLAATLIVPGLSNAKPVKLTFAAHQGAQDVQTKLLADYAKEVESRSNGKVEINFYPGETLIKAAQTYDGVVNGMVDIGFSCLAYTRGRFPLLDYINLPLGSPNAQISSAIINEVIEKFHPKELADVEVLYLQSHGPGRIHTRKNPLHSLGDFKGLKIRAGGTTSDIVKSLGAAPASTPMPEVYQALQKGVMDGGIWDMSASADWKLAEVVDYTMMCDDVAYNTGFFVVMNKDKWNKLDPEVQKIMKELAPEFVQKHGKAWDEADQRGIAFMKELGKEIIEVEPAECAKWGDAVKPMIDTYIEKTEKLGLPGKEVVEFVKQRIQEAKAGTFESTYYSN